jgi:hypothetical protein
VIETNKCYFHGTFMLDDSPSKELVDFITEKMKNFHGVIIISDFIVMIHDVYSKLTVRPCQIGIERFSMAMLNNKRVIIIIILIQDGAPSRARIQLVKSGLTMVYGRCNELVNGDYFMVYKPTYNWGAPSCMIDNFYSNDYNMKIIVMIKNGCIMILIDFHRNLVIC